MNLSGQQRKKLEEALIEAFPDKASLERMLLYELDKNLDEIAGGSRLQEIVFTLIKGAQAQGWIEDLVRAACNSNPGNSQLQAVAEELLLSEAPAEYLPQLSIQPKMNQILRYKFQKRIQQLNIVEVNEFILKLQHFWQFFDRNQTYVEIASLLITKYPTLFSITTNILSGKYIRGKSEEEEAAIGYSVLRKISEPSYQNSIFNVAQVYAQSISSTHNITEIIQFVFLKPFSEYIDEQFICEELLTECTVTTPPVPLPKPTQSQKILILAAIPYGLRLDREIREIEDAIRRATRRDLFEIRIKTAVSPQDIRRALAEEKPHIVHFCGHGTPDGCLVLEDDSGNHKPITPQGLATLFKLYAKYVNCVVLNVCYSEKAVHEISQHINYAIGMNQPIGDKAAIVFAQGFYDGLGYDGENTVARAYEEGLVAIQMEDLSQGSIPVLKKKLPVAESLCSNHPTNTDYAPELKYSLEYPDGHVPLSSPFYVEHGGIESLCYETLLKPGSLIRIKAPKLMGKTSLLTRILAHSSLKNYQAVYLDLGGIDKAVLTSLDRFLRWLCSKVSSELDLDNKVDDAWNTQILGSNDNCTAYFKKYILAQIDSPLVLSLDEVDRLFAYSEVVEDFFGMLRSWHEKGKISDVWKKLRLVLAHSTEVYIPLDIHQSPFNAGVPVELEEFNQQQVQDLAQKHGLLRKNSLMEELRAMVGGHPYLIRLAMYHIAAGKVPSEDLLESATTEAGIYANHLRSLLNILQPAPELAQALKKVVNSTVPVELDSIQIYKLHSLGLVHRQSNHVMPRCQLYREYFRRVL